MRNIIMRGDIAGVQYKSGRFWGVTREQGPWKTTPADRKRDDGVQVRKAGGGIGIGINDNTTNANSRKVVNPYTVDATRAPSTKYFQQSIVYKKDYKPGSQVVGKKKIPSEEIGLLKKLLKSLTPDLHGNYPMYENPTGPSGSPGGRRSSSGGSSIKSEPNDSPVFMPDTDFGMIDRLSNGNLPSWRQLTSRQFGF